MFYRKKACIIREPIVSYHRRTSQSNSHNLSDVTVTNASHDVTEGTSMSRILPPFLSLTGHSIKFNRSDVRKPQDMYSLVDRSHKHFPAKDSVIILPQRFVTSTPKS